MGIEIITGQWSSILNAGTRNVLAASRSLDLLTLRP
jgi:hypothetical protein